MCGAKLRAKLVNAIRFRLWLSLVKIIATKDLIGASEGVTDRLSD